jgi:uncharacterized protein involved in exopolysaccharide biosynthesis
VYVGQQVKRLNDPASVRAARYSDELKELKDKVDAAQDRVTAYRQHEGMPDMGGGSDNDSILLATLQQRLLEAQNVRRAIEVKQIGNQEITGQAMSSMTITSLKGQLSTMETQLAQARTTLGEMHPKVVELKSQIEATRRQLNKEYGNVSDSSSADLTAQRELESKLSAAVEQQRAKVLATRKLQDDGAKLLLELDSAKSVYKRALDGYDQILAAATGGYSNVSLSSAAEIPVESAKPKKGKLLIVAIMAGLALAVAVPLAYELLLNRRVRCRDDLENDMGVPVLAEFFKIAAAGTAK